MMFMLDTNICIYLLNKRPVKCYEHLAALEEQGKLITISSIVHSELQFGVENSLQQEKNQINLNLFLAKLEVRPYTDACSYYYGKIRYDLKSRGCLIGANDMLIAAHALTEKAILVTNNQTEFNRIPELNLEDWSS